MARGIVGENVFAKLQNVLFGLKEIQQSAKLVKGVLSGKQTTFEERKPS